MAISDFMARLPVLNQQQARPVPKGPSRLQLKVQAGKDEVNAEAKWKKAVRKRDGMHCRWCKRKVAVSIALVPERAEVHHLCGRVVEAIRAMGIPVFQVAPGDF